MNEYLELHRDSFFGRFFLHIHLLYMMGRFYFQTIIDVGVITSSGFKVHLGQNIGFL